jgi:hypothetical protein
MATSITLAGAFTAIAGSSSANIPVPASQRNGKNPSVSKAAAR